MKSLPTPDPAQGLFETLLILDGEPVELDAHLDRLEEGLAAVFDARLPAGLAAGAAERAHGLLLGRLRIVVAPDGEVTLATQTVNPTDFFPTWERGADLRSAHREGGLGHRKWADRRPLGEAPGEPLPLLFDRDDEVLEGGRANLFAVFGETLRTPRADGRILPGIARAAAIDIAHAKGIEVREERLNREDLLAADAVFLTGSIRGVEPARSLDGVPLATGSEIPGRIGAGLRRRWRTGRLVAAGS